jgi:hypothetical protein
MKRRNALKFAAALMAVTTAFSLMSVPAFAATSGGDSATAASWQVSKSKTATALDGNNQTTVTLSLPSAEEKLTSDIVFVLDKSSCGQTPRKRPASCSASSRTPSRIRRPR